MKKIILQIIVSISLVTCIGAQRGVDPYFPYLVDEFEHIPYGDLTARTFAFADDLSKYKNKFGLVRISGGIKKYLAYPYFVESVFRGDLSSIENYSDRVRFQQCDTNKKTFRVRVYLSDRILPIQPCDDHPLIPNKPTQYEAVVFHYDNITPSAYETVGFEPYENPNGEYSKSIFSALSEMIDISDGSIYLIGYLGTNRPYHEPFPNKGNLTKRRGLDPKPIAKKIIANVRKELELARIDSSKIQSLEGGYVNGAKRVEIWFVPKGGELPKPKPDKVEGKK